ncbi:MAG: phage holin family protein [Bacteroidales bacterium]|nr:phage holin family protein [Bacteroidales bacterium]
MTDHSLVENLSELKEAAKKYIQANIDLVKIRLMEKLIRTGTYFFSVITVIIVIAFILMSLTLAFSFWYGKYYDDLVGGFLISAGFYILIGLALIIFRKSIFTNSIIRNLAKILFSDNEKEKK